MEKPLLLTQTGQFKTKVAHSTASWVPRTGQLFLSHAHFHVLKDAPPVSSLSRKESFYRTKPVLVGSEGLTNGLAWVTKGQTAQTVP